MSTRMWVVGALTVLAMGGCATTTAVVPGGPVAEPTPLVIDENGDAELADRVLERLRTRIDDSRARLRGLEGRADQLRGAADLKE